MIQFSFYLNCRGMSREVTGNGQGDSGGLASCLHEVSAVASKLSFLPFSRKKREAEKEDTQFCFPSLLDFSHAKKSVKVS